MACGAEVAATYFGEAKIEDLGLTALGNHDVGGFDVAMDDARGVGHVQGIGDLDGELQQRIQIQGTAGDLVGQDAAVEVLHDDESAAVLLPDVMDRADVGVIEGGCRLRLALEAGERQGISGHRLREKLESDEAMQARVFRLVNHAHAPAAQFLDDAVVRDGLADHWSRILRPRNRQVNENGGVGRDLKRSCCLSKGSAVTIRDVTPTCLATALIGTQQLSG